MGRPRCAVPSRRLALRCTSCQHSGPVRQARLTASLDRTADLHRLVRPLVDAVGSHVMSADRVHADDTTVPVLDPGLGHTKTGRLWCYVRDDRPWRGPDDGENRGYSAVFFAFSRCGIDCAWYSWQYGSAGPAPRGAAGDDRGGHKKRRTFPCCVLRWLSWWWL